MGEFIVEKMWKTSWVFLFWGDGFYVLLSTQIKKKKRLSYGNTPTTPNGYQASVEAD